MNESGRTRDLLIQQWQMYPKLRIKDIFKFLYQSTFGCEHLVTSEADVLQGIREEYNACLQINRCIEERLDGDYHRVSLDCLSNGLSADTLGKLFVLSAKEGRGEIAALEKKLSVAHGLIKEGRLPFSVEEFDTAMLQWKDEGYPPIHHSEDFRNAYSPSYRVISHKYVLLLPLLTALDTMLLEKPVKLAIEGGSGSGKTTLAALLSYMYDCTVIHMDDFFLRPEQRTTKRLSTPGGNIDYERFHSEILLPLKTGREVCYRKYDCRTELLLEPCVVRPAPLTVIEGTYSMHPLFEHYCDLSVFLDITPRLQKERIEHRNTPQMAKRFFEEWIPLEKIYFEELSIMKQCDLTIRVV